MEEPERKRIAAKQLPLLYEQRAVLFRSGIVTRVFKCGGVEVGVAHMGHVFFTDNAATYWTARYLRDLVNNISSELILVNMTLHEPLPVHTDKMESVEALINPGKVGSGSECLILFTWLCKAFQTH